MRGERRKMALEEEDDDTENDIINVAGYKPRRFQHRPGGNAPQEYLLRSTLRKSGRQIPSKAPTVVLK